MIQKKIHYCWFGGNPMPMEFQKFIEGWKRKMPDYEIILWNEDNSPMELPYMKKALKCKQWANLSNYTRLHAVYEHGGIYLDTDVEVIKSFDALLSDSCFFGLQRKELNENNSFNNAIFGAEKNNPFIKKLKEALLALYDGNEIAYLSSPHLTTFLLRDAGYKGDSLQTKLKNGVSIYPPTFFFPYSWEEEFSEHKIFEETYAVHYWSGTWAKKDPKRTKNTGLINRFINRIK